MGENSRLNKQKDLDVELNRRLNEQKDLIIEMLVQNIKDLTNQLKSVSNTTKLFTQLRDKEAECERLEGKVYKLERKVEILEKENKKLTSAFETRRNITNKVLHKKKEESSETSEVTEIEDTAVDEVPDAEETSVDTVVEQTEAEESSGNETGTVEDTNVAIPEVIETPISVPEVIVEAGVDETYTAEKVVEVVETINNTRIKHIYDWESRSFWMENPEGVKTSLVGINCIERSSRTDFEKPLVYVELPLDGEYDINELTKTYGRLFFELDKVNNSVIMNFGLVDTRVVNSFGTQSAKAMLDEYKEKTSGGPFDEFLQTVLNIAIGYDYYVNGTSIERLMTLYGVGKNFAEVSIHDAEKAFRIGMEEDSKYSKYLSADDLIKLRSAVDVKHDTKLSNIVKDVGNKNAALAKLYKLYVDGYSRDSLYSIMDTELSFMFNEKLCEVGLAKKVGDEILSDNTLLYKNVEHVGMMPTNPIEYDYFKYDVKNGLSIAQIQKRYGVPIVFVQRHVNIYNKYKAMCGF